MPHEKNNDFFFPSKLRYNWRRLCKATAVYNHRTQNLSRFSSLILTCFIALDIRLIDNLHSDKIEFINGEQFAGDDVVVVEIGEAIEI